MKMSISRKAVKGAHPPVIEYESLKSYLKPLLKRKRNIIQDLNGEEEVDFYNSCMFHSTIAPPTLFPPYHPVFCGKHGCGLACRIIGISNHFRLLSMAVTT